MKDSMEWIKGQLISIIITACLTLGTNSLYVEMTGGIIKGWMFALLPISILLICEIIISIIQIKPHKYKSFISELSIFFEYCGDEIIVTKRYKIRCLRKKISKMYNRVTWFSDEDLQIIALSDGFSIEMIPNNDVVKEYYIVFPHEIGLFETLEFEVKIKGGNKRKQFKNYYWYDVIAPTGRLIIDLNIPSNHREKTLVLKEFRENMNGDTLSKEEINVIGNYKWVIKRPKLKYSYVASWEWKRENIS